MNTENMKVTVHVVHSNTLRDAHLIAEIFLDIFS